MKRVISTVLSLLALSVVCFAEEAGITNQINYILSLVLQGTYEDGGFAVVSPETNLGYPNVRYLNDTTKESLKKDIQIQGYDIAPLVDQFFEKNRKASRLTLKSDLAKGYEIDYDGKYARYFEKDGGGWEKWYKDHPKAHGMMQVSLPVVDEKAGVVLVYKGTQSNWLVGSGYLIVYKYKDGKLEEIKRVMLWIS